MDVVQLKIRSKHDDTIIGIEALSAPIICSQLTNQNLSSVKTLSEFKNLQFADYEHPDILNLPVGILIGIDYYYAFMPG